MQKLLVIPIVKTILLTGCLLFATSPAVAEPISGDDYLAEPSGAAQKNDTADALALFKTGDYEGSLRLWKEAAKKNPDMPPAQTIMAQLYLMADKTKEAEQALEQAALDAPDDPESYIIMSNMALRDQNPDKAESLLRKADGLIAAFQKSDKRKEMLRAQLHRNVAMTAEVRKDWPSAQKALEEVLKLDPKNTSVIPRIAFYRFQQNDIPGALEKLREAAKDNPKMAAPEAILAGFYQQSADFENMKKWMDVGVKASPKNLATRIAAGYGALEAGRFDDVHKHAIAAGNIDSKSYQVKMLRGLASVCQKDFVAAELFFDAAMQLAPKDFVASNNLALSLIEQEDESKHRRALEIAEANVKSYPRSSSALSTYGWVLYKLGRLDEAEKVFRGMAASGPVSVDTGYYTARVFIDLNRKEEARKTLEAALKNKKGISMYRQEAEELLEEFKKN